MKTTEQPANGHTVKGSHKGHGGKYRFDAATGLYRKVGTLGKFDPTLGVEAVNALLGMGWFIQAV